MDLNQHDIMEQMNRQTMAPAAEPADNPQNTETRPAANDQRKAPARRNPRFVIGSLDFFELIMEQDEQ